MRKRIVDVIMAFAIVGLLTQSAFANFGPNEVPDAGASSLLFAMAVGGLAALRRFLR